MNNNALLSDMIEGPNSEIMTESAIGKRDLKRCLPEIIRLACLWAEEQQTKVLAEGIPLTGEQTDFARAVCVLHPENVRIAVVDRLPTPSDPLLRFAAEEYGLLTEKIRGLTFAYGLFLRSDSTSDIGLLAHELRHVAQYECMGGIQAFLPSYVAEIDHFGYGHGPFEIDAIMAGCVVAGGRSGPTIASPSNHS